MMCRTPLPEKKDIRKQEKIMSYDINKIREDFPILGREVYEIGRAHV